jgi:hypothetical protein
MGAVLAFLSRDDGFKFGTEKSLKGLPNQGWQLDTEIREATIKAAGNGRFALSVAKKDDVLIEKILVPMKQTDTLIGLPNNTTLTFEDTKDLEKYITLAMSEGKYTRQDVLTQYEHFMYGFDGDVACLNYCTWTVNHAGDAKEGLNIRVQEKALRDGKRAYVGICIKDVEINDELNMDYRRFKIPGFYLEFTQAHGIGDVRKNTLTAVYGSDKLEKTGKPSEPWVPLN